MNINAKEEARLKKIAKQNGVEEGYATLKKLWDTKVKELTDKGIEANVGRFATNAILNEFRKQKRRLELIKNPIISKTKPSALYGFIIGDMGMRDRAEEMRRAAKKYAEKNGIQAAVDAQLIDGDSNVLDQRTHVYGKENPNHLEPLLTKRGNPLKIRSRVIFAFLRKNGDKKYKFASFQTSDNKLAKAWDAITTKFFTPCQTFGIIKEETPTSLKVNSSQAESTVSVFKALKEKMDIYKIITTAVKGQVTKIQKVEKHYETFKDAWDRKIIAQGVVTYINSERPTPWGAIRIGLMDPDDEEATVQVLVPSHIKIDFGELSEVIIFGRTKRNKYRNDAGELEDADVRIDAFGVYPLPGLTTPVDKGEDETLEDEDVMDGWLD